MTITDRAHSAPFTISICTVMPYASSAHLLQLGHFHRHILEPVFVDFDFLAVSQCPLQRRCPGIHIPAQRAQSDNAIFSRSQASDLELARVIALCPGPTHK